MNYGEQFMQCPQCGALAESEAVDVGVGLYIKGDFSCTACGWEADGPLDHGFIKPEEVEFAPPEVFDA